MTAVLFPRALVSFSGNMEMIPFVLCLAGQNSMPFSESEAKVAFQGKAAVLSELGL